MCCLHRYPTTRLFLQSLTYGCLISFLIVCNIMFKFFKVHITWEFKLDFEFFLIVVVSLGLQSRLRSGHQRFPPLIKTSISVARPYSYARFPLFFCFFLLPSSRLRAPPPRVPPSRIDQPIRHFRAAGGADAKPLRCAAAAQGAPQPANGGVEAGSRVRRPRCPAGRRRQSLGGVGAGGDGPGRSGLPLRCHRLGGANQ